MAPDPDRTQALDQVLEVTALLGDDMAHGLARLGLTPSRAHLLWVLQERGPSTQRALADALDVSPRNITGLVDALVETGFVTREPHPTDRRATLVTPTDHGADVAARLRDGRAELAGQLFGELAPEQYAALVAGLDATLERLRTLVAEAEEDR